MRRPSAVAVAVALGMTLVGSAATAIELGGNRHHSIELVVFVEPRPSAADLEALSNELSTDPQVRSYAFETVSAVVQGVAQPNGASLLPCHPPVDCGLPGANRVRLPVPLVTYFKVVPRNSEDAVELSRKLDEEPGVLKVSFH